MADAEPFSRQLQQRKASLAHGVLNTILAVLAALTATASALAHHYDVVVRPEVCPAVRNVPTVALDEPERGSPLVTRAHPMFP